MTSIQLYKPYQKKKIEKKQRKGNNIQRDNGWDFSALWTHEFSEVGYTINP